ncbi:hypothetical protein B0H63DRAFT_488022 [Podospora didyma]|uniref:Nucleoporin n=1 Tax=Podospora didyma TaxID=330526 RepID=A0AAE0N2Z0_9PEZI|nr:hypothetical protein B0H63DRAFT_488022 [Podospora didyma]
MPRIKSFAPSWLNEPAPGHKLFEPSSDDSKIPSALAYARKAKQGPRRTIARRGTEVFVAVGKQIRWGDLVQLKESWEAKHHGSSAGARFKREESTASFDIYDEEAHNGNSQNGALTEGYRVLKTPVADDIRQLIMSPEEDYLAIVTSHTVHICTLPDVSHLHTKEATLLKPKCWTLGPTTHVTSRPAVASVLWHPLGVNGLSLVTVTRDAVVRVWELSPSNRWSFDSPSLAIDAKKLADGSHLDQDFSASTAATNKAFSPDSFDMEVAAACFPGPGSGGWSAMTLWIAMTGGDVYALCPLLPLNWAPPPYLIPSLSVSVAAKVAATEDDPMVSSDARNLAQQQMEWMSDLDNQEPKEMEGSYGKPPAEVYTRPTHPGRYPKLQGPFEFQLNPGDEGEEEEELKDVYVIGEKVDTTDLMFGEEEELDTGDFDQDGLSLSIICLLSTSGQVKVCLDIDGVEAQWLPPRGKPKSRLFQKAPKSPSLLTFQTFDTVKPAEVRSDSWPMFSDDMTSRYSFYVTHSAGITFISLAPWVFRLECELQADSEAGSEFRIDLLAKSQVPERERIYTQAPGHHALAAATAIRDPDLGHFVLSATPHDPVALFFDVPKDDSVPAAAAREATPLHMLPEWREPSEAPPAWEPRPLFHPSESLDHGSALPEWIGHLKTGKRRTLVQQEVRLSIATLEVFSEGHRLVSSEILELNNTVAELFRKCEALQGELREQITRVNAIKPQIEVITGEADVSGDEEPIPQDKFIKDRLRNAQRRQRELKERMERLRVNMGRASGRELSDKERAWMDEVRSLQSSVLGSEAEGGQATSPNKAKQTWKRLEEVKALRDTLFSQAEQLQKRGTDGAGEDAPSSPRSQLRIPTEVRKAKVAQVMAMLDRETALVDATKSRLEKLTLG